MLWFQEALTRLRDRVTGMREIEGMSSLAEAMKGVGAVPALYLVPLAEKGQEMPHTGDLDQFIGVMFGVIFAMPSGRTSMGLDAVLALEAKRREVRAALVGWAPDQETGEPITFVGGELIDLPATGHLWWADDFQLTTYYRSNP